MSVKCRMLLKRIWKPWPYSWAIPSKCNVAHTTNGHWTKRLLLLSNSFRVSTVVPIILLFSRSLAQNTLHTTSFLCRIVCGYKIWNTNTHPTTSELTHPRQPYDPELQHLYLFRCQCIGAAQSDFQKLLDQYHRYPPSRFIFWTRDSSLRSAMYIPPHDCDSLFPLSNALRSVGVIASFFQPRCR